MTKEWMVWGAGFVAAAAMIWVVTEPRTPPLPRQDTSLFQLTDQSGHQLTKAALRGRPYALFFGFAACGDVCPTTLQRLSGLKQELGERGKNLKLIFVSTDPGRDTPAAMQAFLSHFSGPITGLTGNFNATIGAEQQFQIVAKKVPLAGDSYTIVHSAPTFLVDPKGRVVSVIQSEDSQDLARLKLQDLMAGAKAS